MLSVRVPATSANLGPGFDCLGLAVSLQLSVSAQPSAHDQLNYCGEGSISDTPHNLIHQGFHSVYQAVEQQPPKIRFDVDNPIPLARGLGSSSAALVAGAALADRLLGEPLGRNGLFQLTAKMEGHPDNVAPAIYGGFTVSALTDNGTYLCQPLPLPETWHFLFAVPDFELLTSKARGILPESYSRPDIIFNTSRTALWTTAVALNKPELLGVASQDRLHEPYRETLIPGLAECRTRLLELGAAAAYLSGAGPSLAAISTDRAISKTCKETMQNFVGTGGRVLELHSADGFEYAGVSEISSTRDEEVKPVG